MDGGFHDFGRFGIIMPGFHHLLVYGDHLRLLGELGFEEMHGGRHIPVEDIINHPQREHVAGLLNRLMVQAVTFQSLVRQGSDRSGNHIVRRQASINQRIRLVIGFHQGFVGESVRVHDNRGSFLGPLQIRFQRSRVHGHQYIALVT